MTNKNQEIQKYYVHNIYRDQVKNGITCHNREVKRTYSRIQQLGMISRSIINLCKVVRMICQNIIDKINIMLSYISKKVSKAYKAGKQIIIKDKEAYKETYAYKLIRNLQKNESEVLSSDKLNELAMMSYQLEQFQLILQILLLKIATFEENFITRPKCIKQFRNILNICSYLIKNGASGFIDEFRQQIPTLTSLINFHQNQIEHAKQEKLGKKYEVYLEQNQSKLRYIIELLKDKNKLIKQKEISMLVKQKILLKQKENIMKQSNYQNIKPQGKEKYDDSKVDGFLENYVWKYIDIIDDKLDNVAEIIASKIEKYLAEEVPESFSIEELDTIPGQKMKTSVNFAEEKIKQQENFLKGRQKAMNEKRTEQENLLQL